MFDRGCHAKRGMPAALPPPGYEEIHQSEFAKMFGRIIGTRLLIAPVVFALLVVLALWDGTPWRLVVLITMGSAIISLSLFEACRYRRRGMTPRAADLNLAAGVLGQLVGTFATGGLESPFLPMMPLITLFLAMIMVERPWYYWALIGTQLIAPWALAAIAIEGSVESYNLVLLGGGARAGHSDLHLWTTAAVMNLAVLMAKGLGRGLRRIFDGMLWHSLEANEQLRREHAERSRELVGLSGEIAHELKNPMASVKGLSALLEQNVDEGKGVERLKVLRREVDRMQGILEEFLNFSRPLVPLALEKADLSALCADVAELHEGLARGKGVEILVRSTSAPARCDARKVKQILVNLVQNALDASPPGKSIELVCASEGELSRVQVLDRGPGLAEGVRGRLFEPGITTKPRGSGLGLTIARALARQHGGDLVLSVREGGGCSAQLTLPVEPSMPDGLDAAAAADEEVGA
ncbi:MAG: HAMP domain-containing histidine kinase [Deltaproteobacteria bacterium]|nr:HAMP domain-containing histidine kinase [Deltaproteobacteria bacterium]